MLEEHGHFGQDGPTEDGIPKPDITKDVTAMVACEAARKSPERNWLHSPMSAMEFLMVTVSRCLRR